MDAKSLVPSILMYGGVSDLQYQCGTQSKISAEAAVWTGINSTVSIIECGLYATRVLWCLLLRLLMQYQGLRHAIGTEFSPSGNRDF